MSPPSPEGRGGQGVRTLRERGKGVWTQVGAVQYDDKELLIDHQESLLGGRQFLNSQRVDTLLIRLPYL